VADGVDKSDIIIACVKIRSLKQYLPSKVAKNLLLVGG
jgi:hypothetical protein